MRKGVNCVYGAEPQTAFEMLKQNNPAHRHVGMLQGRFQDENHHRCSASWLVQYSHSYKETCGGLLRMHHKNLIDVEKR